MILKLILLFILCVMFLFLRRLPANKPHFTRADSADSHNYHAVEITASDRPCACARELSGQRILSSEFNRQVLQRCDKTKCSCLFKHFPDRRNGLDRRINRMIYSIQPSSYGRRRDDIHNKARFRLARDKSTNQSLAGTV